VAAFTSFEEEALDQYLEMFGKGRLASFSPIAGGIENSNYFVHLENDGETSEFVLTIMEDHSFAEIPFFGKILSRLRHFGLPVAAPETTLDGMTSTTFCDKPAFLFRRLPGIHLEIVNEHHCEILGKFIASLHKALDGMEESRDNPYDFTWMRGTLDIVKERLSGSQYSLLSQVIEEYAEIGAAGLPSGLIHGDLFRDNTLFVNDHLTGVIDFYHACHDLLIQDLAIAINDWCRTEDNQMHTPRRDAMISGYESVRPLLSEEKQALIPIQRVSAARFALTRFLSGDPPLKNPTEMIDLARTIEDHDK
jgi:homoserine kinase type II